VKSADTGIWVSELNQRARAAENLASAQPVRFYDTTLRDGEQTIGVVLDPQQKLELAKQIDSLGIDRIEAGFPRVSAEDAEAIQLISRAGLKAEIWGFARAAKADVEELLRLQLRYSVIEIPVSEIKLKAYGFGQDEALRRISDAIGLAAKNGIRVAFFPVDSTRA
jgi:isopropylmalate/homocitrate/citramalate synthase